MAMNSSGVSHIAVCVRDLDEIAEVLPGHPGDDGNR